MTVLCPGGAGALKPGQPEYIVLTTSAIGAMLNNIPTAWAVPLAASVGLLSYHLSTFCPVDPPGYPTFSLGDWALIFSAAPGPDAAVARQKLIDTIDTFLWYQMCQCSVGTTPTRPAPPTAPTDAPTVNPPGAGPPFATGTPCYTFHTSGTIPFGGSFASSNLPALGVTYVTCAGTASGPDSAVGTASVSIEFLNSAGGFVAGGPGASWSSGTHTVTGSAAVSGTGITQFNITTQTTGGFSTHPAYDLTWNLYCGTTPGSGGGSVPTPCVADPQVQITLDQILSLLTLVQRNAVPFAYIPGASHSGLAGSGSLTIPRCIGVAVTLTTIPGYVGEVVGTPLEYFSAGWFSWGDTLGFEERVWISKSTQLAFPAQAERFTRLDYNLNPGVVATIQELYAEP